MQQRLNTVFSSVLCIHTRSRAILERALTFNLQPQTVCQTQSIYGKKARLGEGSLRVSPGKKSSLVALCVALGVALFVVSHIVLKLVNEVSQRN